VMLPLEVQGEPAAAARDAAASALGRVGLDGLGDRHPSQMSGGQRQRVGIARAIIGGRQVLVADEPTGALDSHTSLEVFELLRGIADSGALVIVATHDPVIAGLADVAMVMTDGRLDAVQHAAAPSVTTSVVPR